MNQKLMKSLIDLQRAFDDVCENWSEELEENYPFEKSFDDLYILGCSKMDWHIPKKLKSPRLPHNSGSVKFRTGEKSPESL